MVNDIEEQSDKNTQSAEGTSTPVPSRDEIMEILSDAISVAHKKINGGRTKHADRDRLKIDWVKVLGYISNIYLSGLKDQELEKLSERIKRLEEQILKKRENQDSNEVRT
jgi:hypothetical protein